VSIEDELAAAATAPLDRTDRDPTDDAPEVPPGTTIGRYIALETVGSGTMGVVVSAVDPTLDRKVAIKLVKADRDGSTSGRQRLLREAQAMAKLQHANVVTVFEVGTYAGRVFLAMEYIAGGTLAGWLEQRRSQREIVAAFTAAGQGLAAAHRAGIVHRDFKPSNVLVATDGRVRVADFGLATGTDTRDGAASPSSVLSMTSTGAILGTPTYMAPEQHRGEPATVQADQFAFCVALYQALYGSGPFEGDTYRDYADNVLAGRVLAAPRGSNVPARLRDVILRGLALAPADRFPDMDALLAELVRDPRSRARTLAIGAVTIVLVGAAAAFAIHERSAADDPCAAADQSVAGLWDPSTRTALRLAFAASDAPGADSAFAHTASAFDQRVAELSVARHDACVATAVRHEQSAELLDRRMECLDSRAAELANLIDVLSDHPDTSVVERAPDAARALRSLAPCADRESLLAGRPLPTSPAMRAQVAALSTLIDRADALDDAGKLQQAHASYTALMPEADRLDYAPVRLRAHLDDALVLSELGEYQHAVAELRAVGELAASAHDDTTIAKAWTQLYGVLAMNLGKVDEAKALDSSAAAAVARAGGGTELHGQLEQSRGGVELAAGNFAASCEHFATAVRELGKAIGPTHPVVVNTMLNYAMALDGAGRYDEARQTLDRVLAIRVDALGPDHVDVATVHHQLGALLDDTGQPAQALLEFQKAYAIDTAVYAADDPQVAIEDVSLGVVLVELDRASEALAYNERAVAIFAKHGDDAAPMLATALLDLADTDHALARDPEAIRTYEQALALAIKLHGADHVDVANVLNNEAEVVAGTGDHARAHALWQRALAIRVAALGPEHPDVAKTLGHMADDAYDTHAYADAIASFTRAIAVLDKPGAKLPLLFALLAKRGRAEHAFHHDADAVADLTRARDGLHDAKLASDAAEARLLLADTLWDQGSHAAGIAEAKAALAELDKPDELAQAREWLARHR
jgi:tetratricopeptide (TPR) repeat protein/predicted Ser/Thr protein kinase